MDVVVFFLPVFNICLFSWWSTERGKKQQPVSADCTCSQRRFICGEHVQDGAVGKQMVPRHVLYTRKQHNRQTNMTRPERLEQRFSNDGFRAVGSRLTTSHVFNPPAVLHISYTPCVLALLCGFGSTFVFFVLSW